jgi:hypothetical protein
MSQPLCLTDNQLTTIFDACSPLEPEDRDTFLRAIAHELRGRDEVGDGELFKICIALQRQYFTPPEQPGVRAPRPLRKFSRRA